MVKMGTVWDRTAEFLTGHLGVLTPIALFAIFVPTSISSNLRALMPTAEPGFRLVAGAAVLALMIVLFWGRLAVTALALAPTLGGRATGVATRRLPAALAVAIVALVACGLLMLPIGFILVANGVDVAALEAGQPPAIPPGAALALGLYSLALLVAGLWIAARLILVTPAVVAENRALGAFGRSFALTRGMALRIIGVILLYAIVAWVAQWAAMTVFGSIFRLVTSGDGQVSLASVLTTIVVAVVDTGFTVLGTAFTAKLYAALAAATAPRTA